MKLLHAADLHLGVTRYGPDRLADFRATLGRMAESAVANDVDAILLSGDIFNTRRAGPEELAALTEFLRLNQIPKLIIPGNHDGMTVVGDPSSHALRWLANAQIPGVYIYFQPGWHVIQTSHGRLDLCTLPYPHKRAFDAEFAAAGVPVDERPSLVGAKVERIVESLIEQGPKQADCRVFMGHISTIGAKLGSEAALKMGWDAAIRAELLDDFHYAALGHIHRCQAVGRDAYYSGSPDYLDFGDLGSAKGWLIVEAGGALHSKVEFVGSGCRPMVELTMTQEENGTLMPLSMRGAHPGQGLTEVMSTGPIVRLVVTAKHERPRAVHLAEAHSRLRAMGASFIKTEVRLDLPEARATVTVDPEADIAEALASWLTAKGMPTEPTLSVGRELIAVTGDLA